MEKMAVKSKVEFSGQIFSEGEFTLTCIQARKKFEGYFF
jgi:hypothetical protein